MTIIYQQSSSSRPFYPQTHRRSASSNQRFSHLFNTVLGSPFLTTTDLDLGLGTDQDLDLVDGTSHAVPHNHTITRPSSPAPTADFSIIDIDPDDEDARYPYRYAYQAYNGRRQGIHGRSVSSLSAFGKRGAYPLPNPILGLGGSNNGSTPLKSIFPRLWDALSSPARSFAPSPSPPSTPTPSATRYNTYSKGKTLSFDYQRPYSSAGYIDYSDLPPLDGEEGELIAIDDEACFIDVTAVTGIDILFLLPPELALHILTLLCTPSSPPPPTSNTPNPILTLTFSAPTRTTTPNPTYSYPRHSIASTHRPIPYEQESAQTALTTLLSCCAVSRTWRAIASDNTVWRALFLARWGVDLRRASRGTRERHVRLLKERGEHALPSTPTRTSMMMPIRTKNPGPSPSASASASQSPNLSASMRMRMAMKKRRMKDIFSPSCSSPALLSSSSSPSYSNPFLSLPNSPVQMRSKSVSPTPPRTLLSTSPIAMRTPSGPGHNRRAYTTPNPSSTATLLASESKLISRARRSFSLTAPSTPTRASRPVSGTPTIPVVHAPLKLDWRVLYRERMELEKRWNGTARVLPALEGGGLGGGSGSMARLDVIVPAEGAGASVGGRLSQSGGGGAAGEVWEPRVMRISGHTDSVYCLEFDSTRIITGSRDRTIKVWSLKSGRLLGTFWGAHRGSVLCLKFEGDWEREWEDGDGEASERDVSVENKRGMERKRETERKGFMVSGSSDCSVCVWDLTTGKIVGDTPSPDSSADVDSDLECAPGGGEGGEPEREVNADVRAVLKGHVGGVLDLRIDRRWIVSCSKDAVIRVWDRITLDLHRTLRGHEGPVNAVGLQSEKVVSASGDGKMILWDIESGERLRTFEGHDRGLACIEFKDDLIVSGSNDCKIKVWSASTGECLRTLVGHEALVRALSFDPRSGRLVSASYDKTVKLWDLGSGKMVREFKNIHTSHIFDVRFDVGRIVSTSHDQKIVVLDFTYGLDASLFV